MHHGFYAAYHDTTMRPCIINAVQRAKEYYGDIGIMVTGHSMGGAMASFCGLDLVVNKLKFFGIMSRFHYEMSIMPSYCDFCSCAATDLTS